MLTEEEYQLSISLLLRAIYFFGLVVKVRLLRSYDSFAERIGMFGVVIAVWVKGLPVFGDATGKSEMK